MAFEKPSPIVLQSTHGFVADLVGAWLFTEGTGETMLDSSGLANHIRRGAGTGNLWTNPGVNAWYLALNGSQRLNRDAADADFNHTAANPWTVIFWISRRGDDGGTYQRLLFRSDNRNDLAFKRTTWQPAWFNGAAWQDIAAGSAVSGTDEMWAFVYDTTNLLVYKGSQANPGVTLLDSRAAAPSILQPINLFGLSPLGTEDFVGDAHAVFYHRRALTAAQLSTHYSAPFEAFTTPPTIPVEFYAGGVRDGSYYAGAGDAPHLLDWLWR